MKTAKNTSNLATPAMLLGLAMFLGFSLSVVPGNAWAAVSANPEAAEWNVATGQWGGEAVAKAPEDNRGRGRTGLMSKRGFDDPPGDDNRGRGGRRLLSKAPEDNRGKGRTGLMSKRGFDDPPGDDNRGRGGRRLTA